MATMTSGNRCDQLSWSVLAVNKAKYSTTAALVTFFCRMEHASSFSASHYNRVVDSLGL